MLSYLCIVIDKITTKTTTTMGLIYNIHCNVCGSHTDYRTTIFGLSSSEQLLNQHIDTQCAIRCPVCRAKLNTSESDFMEQVTITVEE